MPYERQIAWQALEFQAFVHFGMNTFTDREWGEGTEDPKLFNPTDLDAEQWVEAVKAAGIRGLIVTAKHHDGFCLWPSRFTEHSVKSSPWKDGKGDVVGEVADSLPQGRAEVRRLSLALGPARAELRRFAPLQRALQEPAPRAPDAITARSPRSGSTAPAARARTASGRSTTGRGTSPSSASSSPKAVISIMGPDARWIGNEAGVTRESEWSVIPVVGFDDLPDEKNPGGIAHLDAQAEDLGSMERIAAVAKQGGRLIWYPGQVDVSIRPGWFYHAAEDDKVKTLDHLLDIYYTSVGGNAQLLLNIPPDKRGRIPENDVRRLKELGDRLRATFAENLFADAISSEPVFESVEGRAGSDQIPWDRLCRSPSYSSSASPDPKRFNVAMIKERVARGQWIEAFAFEVVGGRALEGDRPGDDGRLEEAPAVSGRRIDGGPPEGS